MNRIRKLKSPLPPTIEKETNNRLSQITALFASAVPDTTGPNAWRYQRQLSGAVQEFIEALSFSHYLRTQTLISLEEVRGALPGILVTGEDYVMGLFDLTGEIMRFAVTLLSSSILTEGGGEGEKGEKGVRGLDEERAGIVVDLREMRSLFEALTVRYGMRELGKKIEVMQGSVEKVERAAYGILVRGSERPTGWMPELE
ncbi:Translin [Aspergillus avenaceus]|uniref:Translin n=1 Tax=Aspergillus avenaceus TaxID=36643 RepID=A0A5N6TN50_ASPAV|nr:Translin [Aspergillus avenaceus]